MNTLITKDRLNALESLAWSIAWMDDSLAVAEVGVYKGGSLKLLIDSFPGKLVLGFDTFKGLPIEKWKEDEPHKPGDFSDTSVLDIQNFLANTDGHWMLIQGLFPQSASQFEDKKFCFVHIDTDFYRSVKESLEWFWPRMVDGGIIVFDDYKWPNCPGVEKALNEFGQPIAQLAEYQAYITKQNTTNEESPVLT